jgi:hypothetical protein
LSSADPAVIAFSTNIAITRERIAKSYRIHCHLAD